MSYKACIPYVVALITFLIKLARMAKLRKSNDKISLFYLWRIKFYTPLIYLRSVLLKQKTLRVLKRNEAFTRIQKNRI